MADMLRKATGHAYGCCSACARGTSYATKPGPRERHLARQREKRRWRRDVDRERD